MIRGLLFDMDGTLADSERLHWRAYADVLRGFGVEVGIEEYRRHWIVADGGPEYACATYRLPIGPAELRARKATRYRERLGAGVRPMPGACEAIRRLRSAYRLAVATNTARADTETILRAIGVAGDLHAVVAREDYARPKPAPDAYLAAAAALGLGARECVVLEDTPRGVQAGVAAGMTVVAVPSDLTGDADFTGAARRIAGLDALTAELLASLEA